MAYSRNKKKFFVIKKVGFYGFLGSDCVFKKKSWVLVGFSWVLLQSLCDFNFKNSLRSLRK